MSLAGLGAVCIWHDLLPEARDDFHQWHNREHMPERVGIPGFRRGRRYLARYGAPEYFTLYEADSPEVLIGQDYLARLNDPTPWTRRTVPAYFRNTARAVCRVRLSLGIGQGGLVLTLRFDAEPGREEALRQHLAHRALPPLVDMPTVVGVHLCVADLAASGIETAERRGRSVAVPSWVVLIEASTAEGADGAADR